jgi:hypothetical protein
MIPFLPIKLSAMVCGQGGLRTMTGDESRRRWMTRLAQCFIGGGVSAHSGCSIAKRFHNDIPVPNPLVVPSIDFETIWNTTIAVLDEYFDIATENRQQRRIVTQPKVGGTVLEPWNQDSGDFYERVESTLQTIRRYAIVTIEPDPTGMGQAVRVEVFKELEDMVRPERAPAGRAIFSNEFPVNRSREVVGPVDLPQGWIPRGRDLIVEQSILRRLQRKLLL